ncbi:nicotinate (nicotinamide) nucleotide adenylyltransferase [Pseudoflavonifractor sp. MSJ-37]|uniref:nicotinate (nicotinamide) nucleotide adenylyltransferase n=1 Tax=Pseudoflavonifractor sp. MSJ-37 TaxID=2841531 RepID=UPI001C1104C7|nr:nicotinate (nicotinamide) nucleotide adenylyltransferase [Pseudoflavonifractor sp. MSJ-37]MBU5434185.1 nicotinate (nicotinamide) nucleotide adenylyltransferase [Pseudoflavonifractor sp. MSJ-37]
MKIGIYGGTFDPPHLGHMAAARAALDALELDKLLFVPAAVPPHKALPEDAPSAEERLAMTAILADAMLRPDRVEADGLELERTGKSFSSDTVQALRARWPEDELWFLVGTDMFLSLQDWHEPETILSNCGIVAFARARDDRMEALERHAARLREKFGAKVRVIQIPDLVEISSTELRGLLAMGKGQEWLCPSVYGYILMHGLYGTHADLEHLDDADLRACSYSMMKAKRIRHVKGVEEEGVKLALHWGADPEKARKAGILHDCTKYWDLEKQLRTCEKYGIVLDDLERRAVKLLHAKTGAAIARYVFGMPEDVCEAIYWHTTGKGDMTLLDKILYMADYMEPGRDFEGVERLRELAYTDLDEAVLLGCEMSIQDMEERGQPIHYRTQEAYDQLRDRKRD